jgi:hypothetical protein
MGTERRQYPRKKVSWPVHLWVDRESIIGRAVDVSAYGLCVVTAPTDTLKVGRSYRVDVLAGTQGESYTAAVRYMVGDRAGLQTDRFITASRL